MSSEAVRGARGELAAHWPTVVGTTWGCGVGVTGLPFYSLSSFVPLFEANTDWTRGSITGALLALTIGMLIGGPLVGRLVDRYGARTIALASIPLFALGLLAPALAQGHVATLWFAYFVMALVGMGTSPVTYTRLINQRFDRARGLALGITLAGTGIAALSLPGFLAWVTAEHGMTGGYVALALLALTPWLYIATIKDDVRSQARPAAANTSASLTSPKNPVTSETRHFVTIGIAFFLLSLALAGVVVHLVPMMLDAGVTLERAALIASGVGAGVIGARVVIGWLIDHLHAPYVAAVVFVVAGFGCGLLGLGGPAAALPAAALIGIAIGAEVDLVAFLVSRYFPLSRYASIYGWQFGFFAIGAGLSPLFIELFRSPVVGYETALLLCAAVAVTAAVLLGSLGRYRY